MPHRPICDRAMTAADRSRHYRGNRVAQPDTSAPLDLLADARNHRRTHLRGRVAGESEQDRRYAQPGHVHWRVGTFGPTFAA